MYCFTFSYDVISRIISAIKRCLRLHVPASFSMILKKVKVNFLLKNSITEEINTVFDKYTETANLSLLFEKSKSKTINKSTLIHHKSGRKLWKHVTACHRVAVSRTKPRQQNDPGNIIVKYNSSEVFENTFVLRPTQNNEANSIDNFVTTIINYT